MKFPMTYVSLKTDRFSILFSGCDPGAKLDSAQSMFLFFPYLKYFESSNNINRSSNISEFHFVSMKKVRKIRLSLKSLPLYYIKLNNWFL